MHEIDLSKYNIRTDLIIDISNTLNDKNIKIKKEEINNLNVIDTYIFSNNNVFNKKKGEYITISFEDITDKKNKSVIQNILIKYLKKVLKSHKITFNKKGLIIGLGNDKSTCDSLGPKTIEKVLVTKYLFDNPNIDISKNYRNISTFSPGVVANSGIESFDLIKSIVNEIKPDFLIVIDSLATNSFNRLIKTIQITDTGIVPGSGVNNHTKQISQDIFKIPVICIGVPTVIDIKNMIVTPKEIDFIIDIFTDIISNGINMSLHKKFDI